MLKDKEPKIGEAVGEVIYAGETSAEESIFDTQAVYTMREDIKGPDGYKLALTLKEAWEEAARLNKIAFLGRKDWHVPTNEELDTLRRASNQGLLSNTFNKAHYLSSSPDPAYGDCTGCLSFGSEWMSQERMRHTDRAFVRLVCGSP